MIINPLDHWGTLYRVFDGNISRVGTARTSRLLYMVLRGYEAAPIENVMIRTLGGRVLRGSEIVNYAKRRRRLWKLIRRTP